MTGRTTARIAAALIGVIMLFQLAVALGAPWGALTQGGGVEGTLPVGGRVFAVISLVLLGLMAAVLLARAGEGPLSRAPGRFITVAGWLTTAYLGIGILANLITPSAGERALWAPMSAVTFAFALVTMLRTREAQGDDADAV